MRGTVFGQQVIGPEMEGIRHAMATAWAHHQAGRLDAAAEIIRKVIAAAPRFADAHVAMAAVEEDRGALDRAVACYRNAVALKPGHFDAWLNLGVDLELLDDLTGAEQALRTAVRLRPDSPLAHYNLARTLSGQHKTEAAIAELERTLELKPDIVEAHYNLGNALVAASQIEAAVTAFRHATALRHDFAQAWVNLGQSYRSLGRLDEALAALDRAVELAPTDAQARLQRAMALLLAGRDAEGWAEYEWRWQAPGFPSPRRDFPQPIWDGAHLEGRSILLHWEQGLGDTIQFIRYAAPVKSRGGIVLAEVQPRLFRLLHGVAGIDQLIPSGKPLPSFDCHAPLMSLPRILGAMGAAVPCHPDGYLIAEPARIERWRARLRDVAPPRVGLSWQGKRRHPDDRFRSIPLAELAELFAVSGVTWISLQQAGTDEIARCQLADRILDFSGETDQGPDAFVDSAAVIAGLDLVITVDTAMAHLAGALGEPVWVLLHAGPDWRWRQQGEQTPWYPTMRLFRQATLGDWQPVVRRMAAALHREFPNRDSRIYPVGPS